MKSLKKYLSWSILIFLLLGSSIKSYASEVQQQSVLLTTISNASFYTTPDVNTSPVAMFTPGITLWSKGTTANMFYNIDIGGTIYYIPMDVALLRSGAEKVDFQTERTNAINAIYAEVNALRTSLGITALEVDNTLMAIAQTRADDMASLQYFSHYKDGTLQVSEMRKAYKLTVGIGENIVRTTAKTDIGDRFMANWISSSGHYTNMIKTSWKKVGIGISQDKTGRMYGVQVFSE